MNISWGHEFEVLCSVCGHGLDAEIKHDWGDSWIEVEPCEHCKAELREADDQTLG